MAFLDTIQNIFSAAGQIVESYRENIAVTPAPEISNTFSLNRYSNDLKEESPEHQAALLESIKSEQVRNMAFAALGGVILVRLIS